MNHFWKSWLHYFILSSRVQCCNLDIKFRYTVCTFVLVCACVRVTSLNVYRLKMLRQSYTDQHKI